MARDVHGRIRGKRGQTAVEYLLTTVLLAAVFAGMFGVLQGALKKLFIAGGLVILTPRQ